MTLFFPLSLAEELSLFMGDVTRLFDVIFPAPFSGKTKLVLRSRDINFFAKYSGET